MTTSLGQRIKQLREEKGWSQVQLGERCGMDAAAISRYEKGEREPGYGALKALADGLEIRVGYLFAEIPELEHLTASEVAIHESLRLFLVSKKSLSDRRRKGYLRAVDLPAAAKTVQGWKDLEEFMQRVYGRAG